MDREIADKQQKMSMLRPQHSQARARFQQLSQWLSTTGESYKHSVFTAVYNQLSQQFADQYSPQQIHQLATVQTQQQLGEVTKVQQQAGQLHKEMNASHSQLQQLQAEIDALKNKRQDVVSAHQLQSALTHQMHAYRQRNAYRQANEDTFAALMHLVEMKTRKLENKDDYDEEDSGDHMRARQHGVPPHFNLNALVDAHWNQVEVRALVAFAGQNQLKIEAAQLAQDQVLSQRHTDGSECQRKLDQIMQYAQGLQGNPRKAVVDRIIDCTEVDGVGGGNKYFVKWMGLPYSRCTYETPDDIGNVAKIAEYKRWNTLPSDTKKRNVDDAGFIQGLHGWYKLPTDSGNAVQIAGMMPDDPPVYKGGHRLRDCQVIGLNWMIQKFYEGNNSILTGGGSGLGTTVQSVCFLEHLYRVNNVRGPFMIVAPLSTIEHWKREIESWTDMNCVVYHDVESERGQQSREIIRKHEFYFVNSKRKTPKFNILLTTQEILTTDVEWVAPFKWFAVVVDERGRLESKTTCTELAKLFETMDAERRILLTSAPTPNSSMDEMFNLLHFLEPNEFRSLKEFNGAGDSAQQLHALQSRIQQYILSVDDKTRTDQLLTSLTSFIEQNRSGSQKRFPSTKQRDAWFKHYKLHMQKMVAIKESANDEVPCLELQIQLSNLVFSVSRDFSSSQRQQIATWHNKLTISANDIQGHPAQKGKNKRARETLHDTCMSARKRSKVSDPNEDFLQYQRMNEVLAEQRDEYKNENEKLRHEIRKLEYLKDFAQDQNLAVLDEEKLEELELKLRNKIKLVQKAKETINECIVCNDGVKDHVVVPCGHMCCCVKCKETLLRQDTTLVQYVWDQSLTS